MEQPVLVVQRGQQVIPGQQGTLATPATTALVGRVEMLALLETLARRATPGTPVTMALEVLAVRLEVLATPEMLDHLVIPVPAAVAVAALAAELTHLTVHQRVA